MFSGGGTLGLGSTVFLVAALALALTFEFVNGFHDTANAVATVIYTRTLRPTAAVIWSGCWNLVGVLTSSGTVAFGVVALLPVELVLNVGSVAGFAMVFSLLISATLWNLGTWYLGLPASSSHTLIGSILGVGLANSLFSAGHEFGEGVNCAKASEVGISLLISPIVGFACAALLLLGAKALIHREDLYRAPESQKAPPLWIRALLVLTCTAVSFGHGSNDGQKGMGLLMLILIGILPAMYAVDLGTSQSSVEELSLAAGNVAAQMDRHVNIPIAIDDRSSSVELSTFLKKPRPADDRVFGALRENCHTVYSLLEGIHSLRELDSGQRTILRSDLYLITEVLDKLIQTGKITDSDERNAAAALRTKIDRVTKFIPNWVKLAVALALGFGTTVGWKRIVVTVGEKIGKQHLTYAQGAAAELVAAGTIFAADSLGLPVSTTHVLSSGIAGTMAANRSGLQLTLPVCVMLGAGIFAFCLNVLIGFGIK
jgi:PiT family inorganic phosphate transporter